MKHLFVPYDLAVKIKEKGFNGHCLAYYDIGGNLNIEKSKNHEQYYQQHCLAPLYQQVIDWFKDKKLKIIENSRDGYNVYFCSSNDNYIKDSWHPTIDLAIKQAFNRLF